MNFDLSAKSNKKDSYFLKFNMDVMVRTMKVDYNDEVKDTKEAQQLLQKFMLNPSK
jgi:hypothetical protein